MQQQTNSKRTHHNRRNCTFEQFVGQDCHPIGGLDVSMLGSSCSVIAVLIHDVNGRLIGVRVQWVDRCAGPAPVSGGA